MRRPQGGCLVHAFSHPHAQRCTRRFLPRRYELADKRYRAGIDRYLTLLTAQRDLSLAQQQLIQTQLARLTNTADLYRALGGREHTVPPSPATDS